MGYGSYVGALFREFHDQKIPIHLPKLISYGADAMAEADRLLIEREFGVPVISTYQCTEVLRIGFVCEQRQGFHISTDAVAFRVLDDENREVAPGESGNFVVSNLTNRATVLLNYKLGDVVTRGKMPCPCGRTLPMIQSIRGRSDDLLRLADGRVMHGQLAAEPLLAITDVRQVQVVQHAPDRFLLRAVAKPGADKSQDFRYTPTHFAPRSAKPGERRKWNGWISFLLARQRKSKIRDLGSELIPAGARARRHVLHERFHCVYLAAVDFERLPNL